VCVCVCLCVCVCVCVCVCAHTTAVGFPIIQRAAQMIDIIAKNSDGWFEGVIGSRHGLFPGNYVDES
jgi:hypothetical protein